MTGFHYSRVEIPIGDIIVSKQQKGLTYDLVWAYYKQISLAMPYKFGYCYPENKKKTPKCHSDFAIKGNLHYSVYYTMDALSSQEFTYNKKIPLKKRLAMRNKFLRQQASKYFTELDSLENIELISDSWKVVKV